MSLQESELKSYEIPMTEIFADETFNCRGRIAPIDVVDLARDIDANGLYQAIVVEPYERSPYKYKMICGYRRHAAFRILEKKNIPAVISYGMTELQARRMNLSENLKRKDLNILQEAKAIKHFKDAHMTEEEVAKDLGMSRMWVQVRYHLLELEPEIQEEAAAGFLTQTQIRDIYSLPTKAERFEAVKRIKVSKINGEKRPVRVREIKIKPLAKRERERDEIFKMQDLIRDTVGNNFGTRCLAWTAGEISDFALMTDLKELAKQKGVYYEIPNTILEEVYMK